VHRNCSLLILGSFVLAASEARAWRPETYAREGLYVGAAGNLGIYRELEDDLPDDSDVDEPFGVTGHVGYRLHPFFALEAAAQWLPESDIDVPGESDSGSIESWTTTLNAKGYPLTGRVQPFGLVGLGVMLADASGAGLDDTSYDFAARFGGGVDLFVNANLVLFVDASYVLPTGDLDQLDFVSIGAGLGWHF
jgi:opacity protein-like surface antigen